MEDNNEVNKVYGKSELGNLNEGINGETKTYNPYGFSSFNNGIQGGSYNEEIQNGQYNNGIQNGQYNNGTQNGQYNNGIQENNVPYYGNVENATNYDRGYNYDINNGQNRDSNVYQKFTGFGGEIKSPVSNAETVGTNLPVKAGFWNKVKAFCLTEVTIKLTPHQQKIENEINEFLNKEITFSSIKNFFGFGKKNNV